MTPSNCHCGKDGHPLSSVNCPYHRSEAVNRLANHLSDRWLPFSEPQANKITKLDVADAVGLSALAYDFLMDAAIKRRLK